TRTNPSARNAIGVVPTDYIVDHAMDPSEWGITLNCNGTLPCPGGVYPMPVSLVTDGYWTTTAHEIGHTFNLVDLNAIATTGYGFWVDNAPPIPEVAKYDLMSTPPQAPDEPPVDFRDLSNDWISSSEYGTIFNSLLTKPSD